MNQNNLKGECSMNAVAKELRRKAESKTVGAPSSFTRAVYQEMKRLYKSDQSIEVDLFELSKRITAKRKRQGAR